MMTVDAPYQLLIVEDEPDTRAMLQEHFDGQGYEVRVATRGKEAIAQCRKARPDLILLDVQLPDMEGYEVYAQVRRQFLTRHLPVIFVAEGEDRDDKLTGLRLGAAGHMVKPLDLEELSLRVRNTLYMTESAIGLPMVLAADIIRQLVDREEWAAIFLRLRNLDAFDEIHDFPTKGAVLRTTADTLEIVAQSGSDEDFVVHLRGTDFVLVTSPARVNALRREIETRLPLALRGLAASRQGDAKDKNPAQIRLSVGVGLLTNADVPLDKDQVVDTRLTGRALLLKPLLLD
jgi:DNA-binding response OmpR family regulator